MKIVLKSDGSLLYSEPLKFGLSMYAPSPDNPRLMVPKLPKCIYNENRCQQLSCGRVKILWVCKLKQIALNHLTCVGCNERKEQEEGSSEAVLPTPS
jgi:hypothetical protein